MIKELLCDWLKRLNQFLIFGKWRSQFMDLGHTSNTLLCNASGSRTARSWPSDELSRAYLSECTPVKIVKGLVSNFVQQVLALFRVQQDHVTSRKAHVFDSNLKAFIEFQKFSLTF